MAELIRHGTIVSNPEIILDIYLEQDEELLLMVLFDMECYWREDESTERLSVVYKVSGDSLRFVVSEKEIHFPKTLSSLSLADAFDALCKKNMLTAFDLYKPMMLGKVKIEKPWGSEIWFTGIESRGICSVLGNSGIVAGEAKLPMLLAAAPKRLGFDTNRHPVLLKILDPFPEEVLGDLYFELHEEKSEVYIVTNIDNKAWLDGKGAIRMGFNQELRAKFDGDQAFRQGYLEAVKSYYLIRSKIDEINDANKAILGLDISASIPEDLRKKLALNLPQDLVLAEKQTREQMHDFTCLNELIVGDVIKVPTYTPHALQHGVRTVEFQTPVYERMILSFGQKVLSQSHWDTEEAVVKMKLDVEGAFNDLEVESDVDGVLSELVVEFEDFRVLRISSQPGKSYSLVPRYSYQLLMVVQGELELSTTLLQSEQACMIPASYPGGELLNNNNEVMIFLLAQPRLLA